MFNAHREQKRDDVEIENKLSEAMLNEIISNTHIKQTLKEIAIQPLQIILEPLIKLANDKSINSINDFPLHEKNSILKLASRHSIKEKSFGATLAEFTAEEITCSIKNIRLLLNALSNALHNITHAKTSKDVLKFFKALTDLNWCYYELLPNLHSPDIDLLKTMLWPSPEEFDVRLERTELGQPRQLATTYGIRTSKDDLALESMGYGMNSGKSVFGKLCLKTRLEVITKQFDQARFKRHLLKNKIQSMEKKSQAPNEEMVDLTKQLEQVEKNQFLPNLAKMQYYKIPLEDDKRENLALYAKQHEPTFIKLAKLNDPQKTRTVPLVASVSGSTARSLVALQDMGAFYTDGKLDIDKLYMMGCCLMAYYPFCGHHSCAEVGESYNRLWDYLLIEKRDFMPAGVLINSDGVDYIHSSSMVEMRVPYFVYGKYLDFFPAEVVAGLESRDEIRCRI